jgi:outer membrane PBP1 activator LpoA protein
LSGKVRRLAMPTRSLSVILLAVALAACADEKPEQKLVQSEHNTAAQDQRSVEDGRRQRTLGQNESGRIYNQGALR